MWLQGARIPGSGSPVGPLAKPQGCRLCSLNKQTRRGFSPPRRMMQGRELSLLIRADFVIQLQINLSFNLHLLKSDSALQCYPHPLREANPAPPPPLAALPGGLQIPGKV